ncbi:MAG: PqqD family protein [Bacteroidales bacterium]|jgi:hypothetical protein|nr:PqqD family protein [Bacteroidales bacterium]MCI2121288.1 PqqD family protein [Bacteroidales bacterium]MCI2145222.1 PqqD family protein [Bacteroidales bacterium]
MRLNVKYPVRRIGDENLIIIPLREVTGIKKVLSINSTSLWLIESLAGRNFNVGDISSLLKGRFDVDDLVADFDASVWVNQLIKYGIVGNDEDA